MSACHLNDDSHYTALRDRGNPSDTGRIKESMYSHVRRFKLQAQFLCSSFELFDGSAAGNNIVVFNGPGATLRIDTSTHFSS